MYTDLLVVLVYLSAFVPLSLVALFVLVVPSIRVVSDSFARIARSILLFLEVDVSNMLRVYSYP